MIFIGIKNRACEKTKLPLKTHDLRFHSAVVAAERNRRMSPERGRGQSAVSFGGFVTADQTAESDPRCLIASGLIGGFDSAARPPIETADSPKMVKTRRSQGQSPCAVFAQNQAQFRARADVSEHIRETNYTTLKAHQA